MILYHFTTVVFSIINNKRRSLACTKRARGGSTDKVPTIREMGTDTSEVNRLKQTSDLKR